MLSPSHFFLHFGKFGSKDSDSYGCRGGQTASFVCFTAFFPSHVAEIVLKQAFLWSIKWGKRFSRPRAKSKRCFSKAKKEAKTASA